MANIGKHKATQINLIQLPENAELMEYIKNMQVELPEYASDSGEGYQLLLLLPRPCHIIEGFIKALTWLCTADAGSSDGRSQYQVMPAARTDWWLADTCLKCILDSSVSEPLSAIATFPFFIHLTGY